MKDEAAAVGGAEACVKPSRTKASSYAGLQAAAVGDAEACVKPSRIKASSYACLQAAAAAVGSAEEGRAQKI